MIFVHNMDRP